MADEIANLWSKLSITEEEEAEVLVDNGETDLAEEGMEWLLYGSVLTLSHYNKETFKKVIKSVWKTMEAVTITEISDNFFLFSFGHKQDLKKILDQSPWTYDNMLILLQVADPGCQPSRVSMTSAPMWIRVYDLPLNCYNNTVAKAVGAKLGRFIYAEIDKKLSHWGQFLRVRVEVDIRKSLQRGLFINMGGCNKLWVYVRYERLPQFCFSCGRLGHPDRSCPHVEFEDTLEFKKARQYGEWLRTPPSRTGNTRENNTMASSGQNAGAPMAGAADLAVNNQSEPSRPVITANLRNLRETKSDKSAEEIMHSDGELLTNRYPNDFGDHAASLSLLANTDKSLPNLNLTNIPKPLPPTLIIPSIISIPPIKEKASYAEPTIPTTNANNFTTIITPHIPPIKEKASHAEPTLPTTSANNLTTIITPHISNTMEIISGKAPLTQPHNINSSLSHPSFRVSQNNPPENLSPSFPSDTPQLHNTSTATTPQNHPTPLKKQFATHTEVAIPAIGRGQWKRLARLRPSGEASSEYGASPSMHKRYHDEIEDNSDTKTESITGSQKKIRATTLADGSTNTSTAETDDQSRRHP